MTWLRLHERFTPFFRHEFLPSASSKRRALLESTNCALWVGARDESTWLFPNLLLGIARSHGQRLERGGENPQTSRGAADPDSLETNHRTWQREFQQNTRNFRHLEGSQPKKEKTRAPPPDFPPPPPRIISPGAGPVLSAHVRQEGHGEAQAGAAEGGAGALEATPDAANQLIQLGGWGVFPSTSSGGWGKTPQPTGLLKSWGVGGSPFQPLLSPYLDSLPLHDNGGCSPPQGWNETGNEPDLNHPTGSFLQGNPQVHSIPY